MPIVQQASGAVSAAGSFDVSLPAASSASNLVVVVIAGNTVVATPSGWTLRTSKVNFMGHYLWDRAGGAQTYAFSATGQVTWYIAEVQNGSHVASNSQENSASGASYTTPTITPSAGTRIMLASIGSVSAGGVRTVSGWTNGFTEVADTAVAAGDFPMQGVATLEASANGSTGYATDATYSFASSGRTAVIGAYATSSGATIPTGSGTGTLAFAGTAVGDAPTFAPTGLTATAVSGTQVNLSWSALSGAVAYDIERDGVVVVTNHAGTTFSDTGRSPGVEYTYRVRGVL